MARRTGLGRGLDALIPGGEPQRPLSGVLEAPVEAVRPNPLQPRTRFDTLEMSELAESIRQHGIIQPLIVTLGEEADQYILIAGERRLEAARLAGLASVPVIIRDADDRARLELALIENLQRADLGPLEEAEAFRHLAEDFSLSHEEIAARVGKSRAAVSNTLRLLKLPAAVQKALVEGLISEGHARALLALPTPQAQAAALQTILTNGLNVRQTEDLVKRLNGQRGEPPPRPIHPPEITALEERLRGALGTKVILNRRKKGGTVVIHYYSDEELDSIVHLITHEEI
jgi:ParB family chromosome partitioning protein